MAGEYYFFSRKLKEIAHLNAEGADIVSLGIGGTDLPPPPAAVDAAVDCLRQPHTHGYQMTVGRSRTPPSLRRLMVRAHLRRRWTSTRHPHPSLIGS